MITLTISEPVYHYLRDDLLRDVIEYRGYWRFSSPNQHCLNSLVATVDVVNPNPNEGVALVLTLTQALALYSFCYEAHYGDDTEVVLNTELLTELYKALEVQGVD